MSRQLFYTYTSTPFEAAEINRKNIHELATLSIADLHAFMNGLGARLDEKKALIAHEAIKEITARSGFLLDVGLEYLTLDRSARTLSGRWRDGIYSA